MGLFDIFRKNQIVDRYNEEKLYEIVLQEIETNQLRPGLWAKSLAESNGVVSAAQSLYMKLRVQSIIDDIEIEKYQQIEIDRQAKLLALQTKAATYCNDCDNEMVRLYFSGQPTNEYVCNKCRKKVIVND